MQTTITLIDTACVILEINGFRILTDPVLDKAGGVYHFGYGSVSKKKKNPALKVDEIGEIDLVLLSHHQHQDNFDKTGREFTKHVPLVITTKKGAKKLANAIGLDPWQSHSISTEKIPGLKITATPAMHHPKWLPQFFAGKVVGFIIEYDHQTDGVLYITGDTILFKQLSEVAHKYKVDKVIMHLGSVQFPYLTGLGKYTMSSADGVILAKDLQANQIIPIHTSGWSHFKEDETTARITFSKENLTEKTIWLTPGARKIL